MPLSDATADMPLAGDGHHELVDASDLFEQMLEAEIMGSGTYGADPDLDLIEERLSQLRQGPETPEVAEALLEMEPAPEMEPALEVKPVGEIEPQQIAPAPLALPSPPTAMRPTAPPVVVDDRRPVASGSDAPPRAATSADAVVLEASRAAGVAPTYRQPAASPQRKAAPEPRKRPKRSSRLPSFYFSVLALLLVSFALFAVWRPVPDQVITLPEELAGSVAEAAPVVPALPTLAARGEAPVDPQITASVGDTPAIATPETAATTSLQGHAARRIVKLYRVDAQGNIIGLPPTP